MVSLGQRGAVRIYIPAKLFLSRISCRVANIVRSLNKVLCATVVDYRQPVIRFLAFNVPLFYSRAQRLTTLPKALAVPLR